MEDSGWRERQPAGIFDTQKEGLPPLIAEDLVLNLGMGLPRRSRKM